jgi:hypothetical protein
MNPNPVILIIVHKPDLTDLEIRSLQQCFKVLGEFPIKLIAPEKLDITSYELAQPGIEVDFINPKWQSTYAMFNRLKIEPLLYKRYRRYDYILFYELDAWVFKNELIHWCSQGYDYIGAPWFEGWQHASEDAPFLGIGNGGFSLRNIKAHLRVLDTFSYVTPFNVMVRDFLDQPSIRTLARISKDLTIRNNTFHLFNNFAMNEDLFWGRIVASKFKWFKIPDLKTALRFSIEVNPHLYIKSKDDLPFGCHSWSKFNQEFWNQFI